MVKNLFKKALKKKHVTFDAEQSKSKELNRVVSYFVSFKELFDSHRLIMAKELNGKLSVILATKQPTNIESIHVTLDLENKGKTKVVTLKRLHIYYHDKNHTSFDFGTFSEGKSAEKRLGKEVLGFLK